MFAARAEQDDNESLSSVGSMESASVVANCFPDGDDMRMLEAPASSSAASSTLQRGRKKSSKTKSQLQECPHCKKKLSSYNAVQTHLQVRKYIHPVCKNFKMLDDHVD